MARINLAQKIKVNPAFRVLDLSDIQVVVTRYFNMTEDSLHHRTRKRVVLEPRQIAMYFSYKYTRSALKQIGEYYGDEDLSFDHTTVIHACGAVQDRIDTDEAYKFDVNIMEGELLIMVSEKTSLLVIKYEHIVQLMQHGNEKKSLLQRMTPDYIKECSAYEIDQYLQQHGLSLGAAQLFHNAYSAAEFRSGLQTEYDKAKFTLYLLTVFFHDRVDEVTENDLNALITTGIEWVELYAKLPGVYIYETVMHANKMNTNEQNMAKVG